MSLRDRLHEDITAAMRSGDALRRDTLRMAWSSVLALEKRDHAQLSDDATLAVLTREVKTRRESVDAFRKGGREDLAAKEEAEIGILAGYLPQPLTEDELHALIAEAITASGAVSARDLGRVMGRLSAPTRGRADGRHVSELVAQALAGTDLAPAEAADHAVQDSSGQDGDSHGGGGAGQAGRPPTD